MCSSNWRPAARTVPSWAARPCRRRTWPCRCRRGTARRRRPESPHGVGPNGSVIRAAGSASGSRSGSTAAARRSGWPPRRRGCSGRRRARSPAAAATAGGSLAGAVRERGRRGRSARCRSPRRPRRRASWRGARPIAAAIDAEADQDDDRQSDGDEQARSSRASERCAAPAMCITRGAVERKRDRHRAREKMFASSGRYAYGLLHEPPHLLGRVQEEALAALPGGTGPGALDGAFDTTIRGLQGTEAPGAAAPRR